ncbi:MAG: S8 family serine peptidase [Verrucomicrobia bacterium]|nr:S8 family serine peptidase [Verrucomicrobiota bacterium]MBI3869641.1 S8 family serine peptidase [Verrucomicrobiota bacterium]
MLTDTQPRRTRLRGVSRWLRISLILLLQPGREPGAMSMDQARVETRVDAAVSAFGVTGKGVIVAILDRGIDWRNNDFRNPDGSTRIAAMLDLTDDSGAASPDNPYGMGTLYAREEIDDALTTGTDLATRDALGHGTSTAGIACGNGANLAKYRGIAPAATIVVVKFVAENVPAHDGQPAETPFFDLNRAPIAIRFVSDQSAALGQPAVMLLNLGSVAGPADGTSALCRTLDATVGPGIPGLVFVTGTSDDGGIANHAAGAVDAGESVLLQIHKGTLGWLYCDLWYPTNDQFEVSIQTPTASYGPYDPPDLSFDTRQENTGEFSYYHSSGGFNYYAPSSGKREINIGLSGPIGDYSIELRGATIADGRFYATLNPSRSWDSQTRQNYFTSLVVPGGTIWDLASAAHNICPNDYVHRVAWVDVDGIPRSLTGQGGVGELWLGTGVGPLADGRIGVDISAPGDSVFTTYNTNSYWATARHNEIQDGHGLYGRASATSAANPIVTGIIALMLEMNPRLDAARVKRILQQTARADAFTGVVPNAQWGYGKVDAFAALSAVRETLLTIALLTPVTGAAKIQVRGATPGVEYRLEASEDLRAWSKATTGTATASELTLVDPNPLGVAPRFYRVTGQ